METGGQKITSTYTVPDQITEDGFSFHDAESHPVEQWTIAGILADWHQQQRHFAKVMPRDYKRVLEAIADAERSGKDPEEAIMAAASA